MIRTITLSKLQDFSGFEHCWKHLGYCTQLNTIYNNLGVLLYPNAEIVHIVSLKMTIIESETVKDDK